ncbi:MAG: hypothetical protein JWM27_3439 [Gemmatimonadetes bacterium]|nr:hypothetical protein [Gemmatimonadota bacterium]
MPDAELRKRLRGGRCRPPRRDGGRPQAARRPAYAQQLVPVRSPLTVQT